eukprot:1943852-Alexandrium_andersonii.AAC.1
MKVGHGWPTGRARASRGPRPDVQNDRDADLALTARRTAEAQAPGSGPMALAAQLKSGSGRPCQA